ncbi:hypothetical protein AVEN_19980-1 [Araneus ventricosus]|uniref:Uncharacterized protein n=1 Tax=Araneus ventricosus TaxID=182803 RepID=A0A4Y2R8T5_ARAVE|nr:hypothetical protein AVEN_19980-1 [Araneus ventricosus]
MKIRIGASRSQEFQTSGNPTLRAPIFLKTLRVGSRYIKGLTGSELAYLKSLEWREEEEIEEQLLRRGENIAPPLPQAHLETSSFAVSVSHFGAIVESQT